MKKLFSFAIFLFLFVSLQTLPSYGQSQEPKELTEARNSYNVELQKATKPVNDRYLPKLEELKKQLTFNGDIKSAIAVEDVITKMSSSQSLQQQGDKDPQELKEIKKRYMVEFETATKPVRSLYLAKLEVLKQQLALSGALKAALTVEKEMEMIKSHQTISKKNIIISDWEMSTNKRSWKPISLPDTGWGCDRCTRYYQTKIDGKPNIVRFRWASDNKARLFVNESLVFDEFWKGFYCTDKPCCTACCDSHNHCMAGLSSWRNLDMSSFFEGENSIIWEVYEEEGGEGFYVEMEANYE